MVLGKVGWKVGEMSKGKWGLGHLVIVLAGQSGGVLEEVLHRAPHVELPRALGGGEDHHRPPGHGPSRTR